MAKTQKLTIFVLLSIIIAICSIQVVSGLGGMVGGRTRVKDVGTNKEIQELGKYCVEEYNRIQKKQNKSNNGEKLLMFSKVVDAEKQIVSGFKYYLKISARNSNGVPKIFDAIVVVKPWEKSRELINFAPSPATK